MTPRNGTGRGTSVGYRRPSGGLPMCPMPDLLRLHADASGDRAAVVVDAEQAPLVAEIRDRIPKVRAVIAYGGDTPAGFEAWDDVLASQPDRDPTAEEASADSVGAQMLYTSGTTGKPKGAVRTTSDP